MAAYVLADIEVTDQEAYEEYRRRAPATIAAYGGRYLARGGAVEVLEGDAAPNRRVILEFDSMEQLLRWYRSPEYAPLIPIRQGASRGAVIAVEGLPEAGN